MKVGGLLSSSHCTDRSRPSIPVRSNSFGCHTSEELLFSTKVDNSVSIGLLFIISYLSDLLFIISNLLLNRFFQQHDYSLWYGAQAFGQSGTFVVIS